MPDGMLVYDAAGVIRESNTAACRILGQSAEQLQGRAAADPRWHRVREDGTDMPAEAHPALLSLRSGQQVNGAVFGLRLPNGGLRWLSLDAQPLVGRDGAVEGVIACLVDLTEKRLQEARLGLTVAGAALGTWELELATGQVRTNDRWAHMLGYEPEQLRADIDTWRDLVHPADLPAAEAMLQAHQKDPSVAYRAELRMRHRQGHWAWVFTAGAVIEHDGNGRPALMLSLIHI